MEIKTDLGWSIVGGKDVKSARSSCHKVAVEKLPAVSVNDTVGILESDFIPAFSVTCVADIFRHPSFNVLSKQDGSKSTNHSPLT